MLQHTVNEYVQMHVCVSAASSSSLLYAKLSTDVLRPPRHDRSPVTSSYAVEILHVSLFIQV